MKSLYVDLLGLGDVLDCLSDVIRERNPHVLLIDNVQEFGLRMNSSVLRVPFVVAVVSPAGNQTNGFKNVIICRRKRVLKVFNLEKLVYIVS